MGEFKEPKVELTPTEYYDIAENHPELKGTFVGEIINNKNKPSPHLAAGGGRRFTQQNNGDIVILGISREGWNEITKIIDNLGPEASMADTIKAISEADFITWNKPSTGR